MDSDERPFELSGKALVLHPYVRTKSLPARAPEAHMAEAVGLAIAIGMDVVLSETVAMKAFRPGTLLGKGKLDDVKTIIKSERVELAILDATLTPVQQRNLEQAWHCKVIDRTGLILEIFAERARTREGVLQVELAQLTYQRSRLVRAWTHLERQRGGLSTVGGPGERQIESDRRAIDDRIALIKRQLEAVTRTRELHRKTRRDAPFPVIALVGYTNAGKSTLFNHLTEAKVLAKDQLFATLDPTMRAILLPSGKKVILSDTVGFISDLPTQLVAAFRATLEEVLEADVLIHVRDASHTDNLAQKQDVDAVLADLGVSDADRGRMIEVLNKADVLDADIRHMAEQEAARQDHVVLASAISGEGLTDLLETIEADLNAGRIEKDLVLPTSDGAALAWLYRYGEVTVHDPDLEADDSVEITSGDIRITVSLDPEDFGRFEKRYPGYVQT